MGMFTVGRSNFALSTSVDSLTIVSSAKPLRIWQCDLKGLGVASSANEALLYRATTVGSTALSGAITPSRASTGQGAAAFAVYSGFGSSTSSTAGDVLWRFGVNGNGGQDKFTGLPSVPSFLAMPSSGYACLRAAIGAGSLSANLVIEELDI